MKNFPIPGLTLNGIILNWLDTPQGQTKCEQELDEFLLSLGLNPGPRGY